MVLGHLTGHRRHSTSSARSSTEESRERGDSVNDKDEEALDSEQGNVLSHIISQLRPGADLSRVTLPTFILEPRSMLERITNFMAHPELMLPMPKIQDPVQRFVAVTRFYLSGWHIKPPGVKKPLNPILGETFTGYWEYPDNTKGYYIAEQTSHHPPKSSYFFMAPEHYIRIDGCLKPRSKFLGNSAASLMEGIAVMRFLNHGERYFVTQPNMYARGILFGKMKYELGDHAYIRCPETGLSADIEFKVKGWVSGGYDAIEGSIKDANDKALFELSGTWNGAMYIKDLATGKKELLFDATNAKETPPSTRPLSEQRDRESQKLWAKVTAAIKKRDQSTATDEKAKIEDRQREEAAERADNGVDWQPSLFRRVRGGRGGSEEGEEDLEWILNAKIDGRTPEEQTKQILQVAAILPGQTPERRFSIPGRHLHSDQVHPGNQQQAQPIYQQQAQPTYQQKAQPPAPQQQQHHGDLIDFGQHDDQRFVPQQQQPPGQTHFQPQPLGQTHVPQSQPAHPPGSNRLARKDSETADVDEFVDAES
ncbi:hypothetical protein W97_07673 [Coniosporium apollinis CBS 100218]|uniref:Oxysterol-binding protein n=1 Tax=Coniosporium apollinis (strain CBS 100218) TaxID=1168221 RepID=R7Z2Z4_CONA1|nr:uncharacterized protein W97_07673 [Coniosporium apollinis CBS 100218]EON68463.1 hypothetical protein W97_07673 [Coniosporium apollinis CBS 100218]